VAACYNKGVSQAASSLPFSPSAAPPRRPLAVWLAGRLSWDDYAALADRLAWDVAEPQGRPPTLLVCELEPTITVGRGGSRGDVAVTDEELTSRQLEIRFVGRGGGAVAHGPGQVVVGLFATLDDLGLDSHAAGAVVARLLDGLEAALRQARCGPIRQPGIDGLSGRSGLLAAVGIAVRHGVVRHGAFVNAQPLELSPRIRTVGGTGAGTMGSVAADLQRAVRLQDLRTGIVQRLADSFGFTRVQIQSGLPPGTRGRAARLTETLGRVG